MRYVVLPSDPQDVLKAAYVETIQGFGVPTICYPGFTAVEGGDDVDSLVDTDFCVKVWFLVLKVPESEFPKGT